MKLVVVEFMTLDGVMEAPGYVDVRGHAVAPDQRRDLGPDLEAKPVVVLARALDERLTALGEPHVTVD